MIGLLRFISLINAAVWFGATVFFVLGAGPAVTASQEIQGLLGPKNFPFYSVAIGQIVTSHYFRLFLVCSTVAVFHLMAEWVYFGKYPTRFWLGLLVGLCLAGLTQVYGIQPRLETNHRLQYTRPQQREAAGRAFRVWRGVSLVINVFLLGGIGVYLWRVANPPDPARFVSTTKFRS